MGLCPRPQLPFLTAKKGNPKNGAPTKILYRFCSIGRAKFGKLALLRQSQILNARPWSQTCNFRRGIPKQKRKLPQRFLLPKAPTVGYFRRGGRRPGAISNFIPSFFSDCAK